MAHRMLCTECLSVGEPDTVLDGSDRVELLAWCCFLVPGLVYCGWRHLSRAKVCPDCGSASLMRESRASAARRPEQAAPSHGSRIRSLAGMSVPWPAELGSPRGRLRAGAAGSAFAALALVAWALALLDPTPSPHVVQAGIAGMLLTVAWVARQLPAFLRERELAGACRAWDETGRVLRIERV